MKYSLRTRKTRSGYVVAISVDDGDILKPLLLSIHEFFELHRLLREGGEVEETDPAELAREHWKQLRKAKLIKPGNEVD